MTYLYVGEGNGSHGDDDEWVEIPSTESLADDDDWEEREMREREAEELAYLAAEYD